MKLGATQYAACPRGRDYLRGAAAAGLEGVEPYVGSPDDLFLNMSEAQVQKLKADAAGLGLVIPSITLGAFNGDPSIITAGGAAKAVELASRAMRFTAAVGAKIMLLCTYVESNPDTAEKRAHLLNVVRKLEPLARNLDISIALENPLPARDLAKLVDEADSDRVGVYYDFGNAVYLGYNPAEEIDILGQRIMAVHIKDSVKGTLGSKHLGEGGVDMQSAMAAIKRIGYDGWFMIETPGADTAALLRNVNIVRQYL